MAPAFKDNKNNNAPATTRLEKIQQFLMLILKDIAQANVAELSIRYNCDISKWWRFKNLFSN